MVPKFKIGLSHFSISIIILIKNLISNTGTGFKKYFKNTSWLFFEKVLRMAVGLFIGIWIARYLGPEQFGLFSYAVSFVGLFTAISTLGLDSIIVRELVKDESRKDLLLGTAFILKLFGSLGVLFCLMLAMLLTSNDLYTNILIFIISLGTILQSFNVIDFYFQSKVASRYTVYASTISLFIVSIVKVILILNEAPLIAFAWVAVLDSFILMMMLLYYYFNNHNSIRTWKFEKNIAISLLKESWPLILSGIVVSVYLRIDQVMIQEMLNSYAVGQYAVAVKLSEIWYFIPSILSVSLWPSLIAAREKSLDLFESRYLLLFKLVFVISLLLIVLISTNSSVILNLLYGKEYSEANVVLSIHIIGGIFAFSGIISSKWFIIEGLQIMTLKRTIAGVVINIILNIMLIPIYGIIGAAIATVISQLVASYLFNFVNIKTRRLFVLQTKAFFLRDTFKW